MEFQERLTINIKLLLVNNFEFASGGEVEKMRGKYIGLVGKKCRR